jgi:hypothetical protein
LPTALYFIIILVLVFFYTLHAFGIYPMLDSLRYYSFDVLSLGLRPAALERGKGKDNGNYLESTLLLSCGWEDMGRVMMGWRR